MRKVLLYLLGAGMVALMILSPAIIGGAIETHYFLEATVSASDGNTVTLVDTNGDKWLFDSTKFSVNDKVKMLMDTNCTDKTIEDDKIIKIFKA